MNPVIVGAASLLVFAVAMIGPQVDDLRWREVHHEYLGVALLVVGLAFDSTALQWTGAVFMADDGLQHAFQRWGGVASRMSLLHLVNRVLWTIPVWRRLNQWTDRVFE